MPARLYFSLHNAASPAVVYHNNEELTDLAGFVNKLLTTLDVWDAQLGFVVINEAVHCVPVGSVLLWPHLRLTKTMLESGAAEEVLKKSMMSHFGRMRKDKNNFQIGYDVD